MIDREVARLRVLPIARLASEFDDDHVDDRYLLGVARGS